MMYNAFYELLFPKCCYVYPFLIKVALSSRQLAPRAVSGDLRRKSASRAPVSRAHLASPLSKPKPLRAHVHVRESVCHALRVRTCLPRKAPGAAAEAPGRPGSPGARTAPSPHRELANFVALNCLEKGNATCSHTPPRPRCRCSHLTNDGTAGCPAAWRGRCPLHGLACAGHQPFVALSQRWPRPVSSHFVTVL